MSLNLKGQQKLKILHLGPICSVIVTEKKLLFLLSISDFVSGPHKNQVVPVPVFTFLHFTTGCSRCRTSFS